MRVFNYRVGASQVFYHRASSVWFLRLGLRLLLVRHPLDAVAGNREGWPLVLGRLEVLLHQLQSCKFEIRNYLMYPRHILMDKPGYQRYVEVFA